MRWLCIVLVFVSCLWLSAAEKPRLAVSFAVGEEHFRNYFFEWQLDEIEAESQRNLSAVIFEGFRFLDLGGAEPGPYRLAVVLDRLNPEVDDGPLVETGFHLTLNGPNGFEATDYFRFRDRSRFLEPFAVTRARVGQDDRTVTGPEAMVLEMKRCIEDRAFLLVLRPMLLNIPLKTEVYASSWRDYQALFLPFQLTEMCMSPGSSLRVEARVPSDFGTMRVRLKAEYLGRFLPRDGSLARFHNHLFCRFVLADEREATHFNALAQVPGKVGSVYLSGYRYSGEVCRQPISPEEAGL